MIIDGKGLAARRRAALKETIEKRKAQGKPAPTLAVILAGDDPASQIYVRNKENAAKDAGITPVTYRLGKDISQSELMDLVHQLNQEKTISGILVQLPLPEGLNEQKVIEAIDPDKDVDGLHPVNAGRLTNGLDGFVPCTPQGAIYLLEEAGLDDLSGKKAVVVGRSILVGKPMIQLLLSKHATVTACHSRTADLAKELQDADIVIAAVGRPELIKGEWIKPGAVVIDVGINRTENGLKGDVEFEAASKRAAAITPVPGGCGPMTIQVLLENTLKAAERQEQANA